MRKDSASVIRVAVRLPDGRVHEVAPMSPAQLADAMCGAPRGAVRAIFDPRTQNPEEIARQIRAIRAAARNAAGILEQRELERDPARTYDLGGDMMERHTKWNIEWRRVAQVEFGDGVVIHYCGTDPNEYGPIVAFIVGFDWRRGASHVVVELMRDDAPVWALVEKPSELLEEIEEVVSEILNGGSVLLKRGRLRVIANT